MGGFPTGGGKSSQSPQQEEKKVRSIKDRVEEIKSTIELEDLVMDNPAGPKICMVGESKSGKSDSAVSMIFMNKEFAPSLRQAGLEYLADALEQDIFPNVERVVIIDTENAMKTQLRYPYERAFFSAVKDRIKRIGIEIPALKEMVDPDTEEVDYDRVSIEKVLKALDDILAAVEWCTENLTDKDIIIFDSASDYKVLLDIVTGYVANVKASKVKGKAEDVKGEKQEIRMGRWGNRTAMWTSSMRRLRSFPGWAIAIFQKRRNKKFVQKTFDKPLLEPLWIEGTEYRFDMVYDFSIDRVTNERNVEVMEGRYVNTEIPEADEVTIYGRIDDELDRYQFLKCIDNMLKVMKGSREEWLI